MPVWSPHSPSISPHLLIVQSARTLPFNHLFANSLNKACTFTTTLHFPFNFFPLPPCQICLSHLPSLPHHLAIQSVHPPSLNHSLSLSPPVQPLHKPLRESGAIRLMVQGHGLLGRPRAAARGLKGPMVSPPHRHTLTLWTSLPCYAAPVYSSWSGLGRQTWEGKWTFVSSSIADAYSCNGEFLTWRGEGVTKIQSLFLCVSAFCLGYFCEALEEGVRVSKVFSWVLGIACCLYFYFE